ncbi:MAG TPA: hypothetical protein VKX17_06060 [Planctomycetota bacterium]|nr:hypothetical protein [Planctomycetota bacterium]
MAFYIVVHHPSDPVQPYHNDWDPNNRTLRLIETRKDFVKEYWNELKPGARIFVHRCGWGGNEPEITCSVEVDRHFDSSPYYISFKNTQPINEKPKVVPVRGTGCYEYP